MIKRGGSFCDDLHAGDRCSPLMGVHSLGCRFYRGSNAQDQDTTDHDDRHTVLDTEQTTDGDGRRAMEDAALDKTAGATDVTVDGKEGFGAISESLSRVYSTPALASVLKERVRQDKLWGEQNHDPFVWLGILAEEVGEYSKEALNHRFGHTDGRGAYLRDECVQAAAVALAMVECLDRGKWDE